MDETPSSPIERMWAAHREFLAHHKAALDALKQEMKRAREELERERLAFEQRMTETLGRRPGKPPRRRRKGDGSATIPVKPDRPRRGEGGAAAVLEFDD